MDLSSAQHAFVTGGAAGIGLGIVDALAQRGLSVTVVDIDAEALESVIAPKGPRFLPIQLDVRDRAGWARAKAKAEATFGPVDVLVNNAGVATNGRDLADIDPEIFDRVIDINLTGAFNGVHAFAAEMRDRGFGHIVNVSSMLGMAPGRATRGPYAAAKAGLVALSESLRQELAPRGVGVSVLAPGGVRTDAIKTAERLLGGAPESAWPEDALSIPAAGELVARAIERNAGYIPTHPGNIAVIEIRMQGIRDDFLAEAAAREGRPLPA